MLSYRWLCFRSIAGLAAVGMLCPVMVAESNADRVQIAKSLTVDEGDKAGDVVCVLCSIRIRGETSGDVVAIAGNIILEQGATVAGDTVAVAGNIRLDAAAKVGGDAVAVAGAVRRDPTATVGGEVTSRVGGGWILLIFVLPPMMLGAFLALIIWIIQRSRRPTVPGYPGTPSTPS